MYVAISSALPALDVSFDVCMDVSNNARVENEAAARTLFLSLCYFRFGHGVFVFSFSRR